MIREKIQQIVEIYKEAKNNPSEMGFEIEELQEEIEELVSESKSEVWEIFRTGNSEEFSVIIAMLQDLPEEFRTEEARKEIMSRARRHGTKEVIEATRCGFGASFDRYWNETEPDANKLGKELDNRLSILDKYILNNIAILPCTLSSESTLTRMNMMEYLQGVRSLVLGQNMIFKIKQIAPTPDRSIALVMGDDIPELKIPMNNVLVQR